MNRLLLAAVPLMLAGIALAQAPAPKRLAEREAPVAPLTASIDLGASIAAMDGYVFTQAVTTVPPGTGRAWHSHAGAPEIVRIVSGVLTDQRNDEPPRQFKAGDTMVNTSGTSHMWANHGSEPVVFINTTVKKAPQPAK